MKTCEMTIGSTESIHPEPIPCGKPAKFRDTEPKMLVEYVCGIHARSLETTFRRIGKKSTLVSIKPEGKVQLTTI